MHPERVCADTPWNTDACLPGATASPILHLIQDALERVMSQSASEEQRARIAALNDDARGAMGTKCVVETTAGFRGLTPADHAQINAAVARYNLWTIAESHDANRDFGVIFKHANANWSQETPQGGDPIEAVFWQIDCFDHAQTQISAQPWDETVTTRVLTLMLATEY
jgi:hypothetical protein